MRKIYLYILVVGFLFASCDRKYDSPIDEGRVNSGLGEAKPKFYADQYDPISDQGQYWHPDMMKKLPASQYTIYNTGASNRNDPNTTVGISAGYGDGLQYHLLSQSLCGLNNKALSEGKTTFGAWMDAGDNILAYKELRSNLKLPLSAIVWAATPLLLQNYIDWDEGMVYAIGGKKYVLTDVKNNPESSNVGIVASHVYNAVIVDVRDRAVFDADGYQMVYDARTKTTLDSWNEFKDKCNNRALVVMPAQTGELADFAIANNLFVVNLNKKYNTSGGGQNVQLFKDVLAWLKPNSPVYGWEPGVGEDEFVNLVSKSGNMMVALHELNLPYFSYDYKNRQKPLLTKVLNPHDIDYEKDKKFVSFYLSDGAHTGWMMNGFVENYYNDANVDKVNMSFGINCNIPMVDPLSFERIMNGQKRKSTLIESFGGGYWYSDDFGSSANRKSLLEGLAKKVASHMRQHRIKVLEQIAHDPKSAAAQEAYQAFVDANDQLEGIIAIQYAPSYAQCAGDIMWVTNKQGYDIPIITVSYSIWNMGGYNAERDGTPTYIANKLNAGDAKFSSVIVHAWSAFNDTGNAMDELSENGAGGTVRGASAAEMCSRRLSDDFEVVNIQELIWRVRMEYKSDQTKKYLSEFY